MMKRLCLMTVAAIVLAALMGAGQTASSDVLDAKGGDTI